MNYENIKREIMNGQKLENLNLKVVYYCRVSTDKIEQQNSLENQKSYYENFIKKNKNWELINGYFDNGKSGVTVEKRKEFIKMIEDSKNKKFDLIITKEVSRFARDLEDSIHYIRKLKENGVGVYFENQNLNTFDINSELILNIMFNLAQEESKKLSGRIKFGHYESMKKGRVLGSIITGYKKENCKLVLDKKEAEKIKNIYKLYSTNKYGLQSLAIKLKELNILNKNNNIYDKETLKRILINPKYKGYYRAHEYEIIDYRTKRRKKIPKEEQIIYKTTEEIIPPIISEELWDKVNKIYNERKNKYKNQNRNSGSVKYQFSSKIICGNDNKFFQRKINKNKIVKWCCSNYIKYGTKSCNSPTIYEEDLLKIFNNIINEIINKIKLKKELDNLYKESKKNVELIEDKIYDKQITENKIKKDKILTTYFENLIDEKDFKIQYNKIKEEEKNILKEHEETKKINNKKSIEDDIENILNKCLVNEFIRKYLEKIKVNSNLENKNNILLEIYLNFFRDEEEKEKNFINKNKRKYNIKIQKKYYMCKIYF